jgi:hypothetical protein
MQLAQLTSAALLLALTPFAAFQTPAKPPTAEPPKQGPGDRAKTKSAPELEAERVRSSFLGVWQLVKFNMNGELLEGAHCRGYLLVTGEFMTLDLQVETKYIHNLDNEGQLFSSTVQRWQFDTGRLLLTTTSMLGVSNFTPEETMSYERTGTRREYRVDFTDDTMTLERDSSSRMFFRRISKPEPPAETVQPETKPPVKK